jgi:hypothetical protein
MRSQLGSQDGVNTTMSKNDSYRTVANQIFNEYNEVSATYDLPPFDSQDELEIVLRDNINEEMIDELVEDEAGRMALAGFLSSIMTTIEFDIQIAATGNSSDSTH